MLSLTSEDIIDEDTCIVCYEDVNIIDNFFCDCKFKYHRDCYIEWLKNNGYNCIVCEETIHPHHIDSMNQISDDFINSDNVDNLSLIIEDGLNQSLIKNNYSCRNLSLLNLIKKKFCIKLIILSVILILVLIFIIIYVFI